MKSCEASKEGPLRWKRKAAYDRFANKNAFQ